MLKAIESVPLEGSEALLIHQCQVYEAWQIVVGEAGEVVVREIQLNDRGCLARGDKHQLLEVRVSEVK